VSFRSVGALGLLLSILYAVGTQSPFSSDVPVRPLSSRYSKPNVPPLLPQFRFPGFAEEGAGSLAAPNLFGEIYSLIGRSQHGQALAELHRRGIGPGDPLFHKVMCASHEAKADFLEALKHCLSAAKINPKDADLLYLVGLLRGRVPGRPPSVERFLTAALRADPNHFPSAVALAALYRGGGQSPDRIEEGIRDAFGRRGYTESDLAHLIGRALASNGQHGEAVQAMERSITSNPDRTDVRIELGREWEALGNREEAALQYAEALGGEATRREALRRLGRVHEDLGRADLALDDYETAVKEYPEAPGLRLRVASLLDSPGATDSRVLGLLEEEVSLFPYLAGPRLLLAEQRLRRGETERAIAELIPLTRGLEPHSPFSPIGLGEAWASSHQLLARIYRSRGELPKAQALEKVLADLGRGR
jgi:tetratricopeptide (TPR) repeat protein